MSTPDPQRDTTHPTTSTLVEELPCFVWTARPDGSLDFVNRRCCEYFARSFEQMIEWGWADIVHPEDLPPTGERWSYALETGEPYAMRFRLRRASDGAYRLHLARAQPRRGPDGRIEKWIGLTTEIEDEP
jgi:PAS domain S-box-containing protein